MKRVKRFGRDFKAAALSKDWFDWFIAGVMIFLGIVAGYVIDVLDKEFP